MSLPRAARTTADDELDIEDVITSIEQQGYAVSILRGPVGLTTVWIYSKGLHSKVVGKAEGNARMIDVLSHAWETVP